MWMSLASAIAQQHMPLITFVAYLLLLLLTDVSWMPCGSVLDVLLHHADAMAHSASPNPTLVLAVMSLLVC